MELNELLKTLREKTGLKQDEIAKKLDISYGTYSAYEKGTRNPSKKNLAKIAQIHNVPLTNLIAYQTDGILLDDYSSILETKINYTRTKNKSRYYLRDPKHLTEDNVKNYIYHTFEEFSFDEYPYLKSLLLEVSFFMRDQLVLENKKRFKLENIERFITLLNVINDDGLKKIGSIGEDLTNVPYYNINNKK